MVSTQSDQLSRHIHTYKTKISSCQGEYDANRFHTMITRLKKQLDGAGDLASIGALRSVVARFGQEVEQALKHPTTAKTSWNTSTRVVRQQPPLAADDYDRKAQEEVEEYFRWYIRFVDYLQQLIQSYHIEVFLPLCSCMSALVNHSPTATPSRSTQGSRLSNASLTSRTSLVSRRLSQPQLSRELQLPVELQGEVGELLSIIQSPRGSQTQENIGSLLQQLNVLLDNDNVFSHDLQLAKSLTAPTYNKDSKGSVMTPEVHILERLLPTVFDKFHDCLRLSEEWMEWDQEQMKQLYMRRPKLNQLQYVLANQRANVQNEIAATEREIDDKYENVHRLSVREDRTNVLNVKVYSLQSELNEAKAQLAALEREKLQLIDKMANAAKQHLGRQVADRIRQDYSHNQLARMLVRREIESSKYVLELLEEDLHLETELKPSFVRFTNDAHEQCEHLEERLEEKKELKDMLDSVLKPLSNHRYETDTADTQQPSYFSHTDNLRQPSPTPEKMLNKVVKEDDNAKKSSNKQQNEAHYRVARTQSDSDSKRVASYDVHSSHHASLGTEFRSTADNDNDSLSSTSHAPRSILKVKPLLQTQPAVTSELSLNKPIEQSKQEKQNIVNKVPENNNRTSSNNKVESMPLQQEVPKIQSNNLDSNEQEHKIKATGKGQNMTNKGFLIPVYDSVDHKRVDNKTNKFVRTRDM